MNTPTAALVWEIWRRGRRPASAAIACLTVSALARFLVPAATFSSGEAFPTLFGLLMTISFLLLMGVFNHTEFSFSREWNGFPYRHFVLPVRTWQLVGVPMLLGVVSVELLYFSWAKLVWAHEIKTHVGWFAILLGSYIIFYQTTLWSLAGLRLTRILALGVGGVSWVAVACLPALNEIKHSPWFSEGRLGLMMIALASASAFFAWVSVSRQRHGGGRRQNWIVRVTEFAMDLLPRRTKGFNTPAQAQFWFEWRRSGLLLPACCALVLLAIFVPFSWASRNNGQATVDALVRLLLMPGVLAFAVGKGFVKPEFWSMNLELPQFLAVRPMADEDYVASKLKVAAMSVITAWGIVFGYVAIWLKFWANTVELRKLVGGLQMFYPHHWQWIIVLGATALVLITWCCMVADLWAGLSGSGRIYASTLAAQVAIPTILLIIAGVFSDKIDAHLRGGGDRFAAHLANTAGWGLAVLVILRMWLAVYSWRRISEVNARRYFLIWSGLTAGLVALAILCAPPLDDLRLEHVFILTALLAAPLTSIGWASQALAKNRHRT